MRYKNTVSQDARFKIIKEGHAVTPTFAGGPFKAHDIWVNFASQAAEDCGAKYQGTTGGIADIATNSLYFVICPSSQSNFSDGTAVAKCTVSSKLRFTDL